MDNIDFETIVHKSTFLDGFCDNNIYIKIDIVRSYKRKYDKIHRASMEVVLSFHVWIQIANFSKIFLCQKKYKCVLKNLEKI